MAKRPLINSKAVDRLRIHRSYHRRQMMEDAFQNAEDLKECPPFYEVEAAACDLYTRAAAVTFVEITAVKKDFCTYGRPDLRVVQIPFIETREKQILKPIVLTDEALEDLRMHPDPLVSEFAPDILSHIKEPELYPSWFIEEVAVLEMDFYIEKASKNIEIIKAAQREAEAEIQTKIKDQLQYIADADISIEKNQKNVAEAKTLITKMDENPKSFFKIPIFAKARIKKQRDALCKNAELLIASIERLEAYKKEAEEKIRLLQEDFCAVYSGYEEDIAKENEIAEKAREKFEKIIGKIVPLTAQEWGV